MKKFMSLMLLVCACLLSQPVKAQQVTPDNAGYIVKVGDMAPDFEMELTDGQKVKLSDLRGKVVMLQFLSLIHISEPTRPCLLLKKISG